MIHRGIVPGTANKNEQTGGGIEILMLFPYREFDIKVLGNVNIVTNYSPEEIFLLKGYILVNSYK